MSAHLDKLKKLQQLGNNVNEKVMNSKTSQKTNEKPLSSKSKSDSKPSKVKSVPQSATVKKLYSLNLNVRNHKLIALHCKINGISMSSLFNDFSQDYVKKHNLEEKYKTLMTDSD